MTDLDDLTEERDTLSVETHCALSAAQLNSAWAELRSACANKDRREAAMVIAVHATLGDKALYVDMMTYARDVLGYPPMACWERGVFGRGGILGSVTSPYLYASALSLNETAPITGRVVSALPYQVCTFSRDNDDIAMAVDVWRERAASLLCQWQGGEHAQRWCDEIKDGLHTQQITNQFEQVALKAIGVPPWIINILILGDHSLSYNAIIKLILNSGCDLGDPKSTLGATALRGLHRSTSKVAIQRHRDAIHAVALRLSDELDMALLGVVGDRIRWYDGLQPRTR